MPDRTRLGTYDTEAEARAELDLAIAELANGHIAPKNVRSFRTAGPRWLDAREKDPACRDVDNERRTWKHIERAPFYDLPLRRITPAMCFEWRGELRRQKIRYPYPHPKNGQPITAERAERIYSLASAFAQHACDSGWVETNAFRLAGRPKAARGRTRDPWTYLEWSPAKKHNEQAR